MAEVSGKYLATNKLKAQNSDVKSLMYGNNKVKMAFMRSVVVWDVWETFLSANNASVGSS